jgi:hypothetical protein
MFNVQYTILIKKKFLLKLYIEHSIILLKYFHSCECSGEWI